MGHVGRKPRTRASLVCHGLEIISVAFSPDVTTLASGDFDLAVNL